MKKVLSLVLVFVLAAALLCGCAKTFTCDLCGDEVTERPHTTEVLGEKVEICEECYEGLQEIGNLFK